jgi:hypothetical protein
MNRTELATAINKSTSDYRVAQMMHKLAVLESSSGRADTSKPNTVGAIGPLQILSKQLGAKYAVFEQYADKDKQDPRNPEHNVKAAVNFGTHLLKKYGNEQDAVLSYLAGSPKNAHRKDRVTGITGTQYLAKYNDLAGTSHSTRLPSEAISQSQRFPPLRPEPAISEDIVSKFKSVFNFGNQVITDEGKAMKIQEAIEYGKNFLAAPYDSIGE